jgi:hypothetical protein
MGSLKMARYSVDQKTKEVTIHHPELSIPAHRILNHYFGTSVEGTIVSRRKDAWLEAVPSEVMKLLRALVSRRMTLGYQFYEKAVMWGVESEEVSTLEECALVIFANNKKYLIAQWRVDEGTPTAIHTMRHEVEVAAMRRIAEPLSAIKGFDAAPWDFYPEQETQTART